MIARIVLFQIIILFSLAALLILPEIIFLPNWLLELKAPIYSAIMAATGGVLYCLRGIYRAKAVNKNWDPNWEVWYYLRPITSLISGIVSYVFLKAGLLVLDADTGDSMFGYLAIAFIAGYNVDNFLKKLEDIANSVWGIKKSNSSSDEKT